MFISHNEDDTRALGERWAREAKPGWVIGLQGELGAGKTQLVKGLARGLGIQQPILSPTFTLVHQYQTATFCLYHLDLYRLDHMEQILTAGLDEYLFRTDGLTVIEWIERWQPPLSHAVPPSGRYRRVAFEILDESRRRITHEDFGA